MANTKFSCKYGFGDGDVEMPEDTLKKLEEAFCIVKNIEFSCMLKDFWTEKVFKKLKNLQTKMGSTLFDVIEPSLQCLDTFGGVYAPDSEAYTVFADIFKPVIKEYHCLEAINHPETDWGIPGDLENIDPEGDFVVSTRIVAARSITGYPFNSKLTKNEYIELEYKIADALNKLDGEFKGTYYTLEYLSMMGEEKYLIDNHVLFNNENKFLETVNGTRYWPAGRGIFYNALKTFVVWVGEEDHLRIISMEKGANVARVYQRLVEGLKILEKHLKFVRSNRYGYLNFSPSNIGTALRASVHIKLPKMGSEDDKYILEVVASKYGLQVRGTDGEDSLVRDHIFDISNKQKLGLTEFQAVKIMTEGVKQVIRHEKNF